MITLSILGSGSSGNSLVIQSPDMPGLMVDCGFGPRIMVKRLAQVGLAPKDIGSLIVTHDHQDHNLGADRMVAKYGWDRMRPPGERSLGGAWVRAWPQPHDTECYGVFVDVSGVRIAIATDLGHPTEPLMQALRTANIICLESNYDHDMLRAGSYPIDVQDRIAGNEGHLSNEQCAAILKAVAGRPQLKAVVLMHISQHNNTTERALSLARAAVPGVPVFAAAQDEPLVVGYDPLTGRIVAPILPFHHQHEDIMGDSVILRGSTESKFQPHPDGPGVFQCMDVVDMGEKVDKKLETGREYVKPVFTAVFASGARQESGELALIVKEMTASNHERSKARLFLESWRGKKYTDAEVEAGIDFSKMEGQYVYAQVVHVPTRAGRVFADLQSPMRVPKGMPTTLDVGDYVRPEYLIQRKAEYAAAVAKFRGQQIDPKGVLGLEAVPVAEGDDDLPF